jgi:hypothetical protein
MALTREKYKRVPDLYVTGKELVLKDDQVMWMQALNPLERDEAASDAQVARARLVMALKSDHSSDERMKVEAAFFDDGRETAIRRLVNTKLRDNLTATINAIRNDPEWKERLEIVSRGEEVMAKPMEEAEQKLIAGVNRHVRLRVSLSLCAPGVRRAHPPRGACARWPESGLVRQRSTMGGFGAVGPKPDAEPPRRLHRSRQPRSGRWRYG